MNKVLFVCVGNICRSPMAEAIFNSKIGEYGLEKEYSADSAGTSQFRKGEMPYHYTVKACEKNNVTVSSKSRGVKSNDFVEYQWVIGVTKNINAELIISFAKSDSAVKKIILLGDFDPEYPGRDIPDPYMSSEESFDDMFVIIERCVINFIKTVLLKGSN